MRGRRLLDWAALPVTDRRWAAPLSAAALGFGLFVGIALSPGAAGTFAGGAAPLLLRVVEPTGGSGEQAPAPAQEPPGAPGTDPNPAEGVEGPLASAGGSESVAPETSPLPAADPVPPVAPDPQPTSEPDDGIVLEGTVVHVNPAAGSYAVAEGGGALSVVHAGKPPQPGTEIEIPVRPLSNGTYAEAGRREDHGSTRRATLLGTVSRVIEDPVEPGYVLSARGVSVVVWVPVPEDGSAADLPQVGTLISAVVGIEVPVEQIPTFPWTPEANQEAPACAPPPAATPVVPPPPRERLWQQHREQKGEPGEYVELAGVVVAVCPELGRLSLSADDTRLLPTQIELSTPPALDVSSLTEGASVTATASVTAGAFTLAGIASDERIRGADETGSAQGDLRR